MTGDAVFGCLWLFMLFMALFILVLYKADDCEVLGVGPAVEGAQCPSGAKVSWPCEDSR